MTDQDKRAQEILELNEELREMERRVDIVRYRVKRANLDDAIVQWHADFTGSVWDFLAERKKGQEV